MLWYLLKSWIIHVFEDLVSLNFFLFTLAYIFIIYFENENFKCMDTICNNLNEYWVRM